MKTPAALPVRLLQALAILAGAALALATHPGRTAEKTPLAFLQELYAPYETSDKGVDMGSRAKAARYFIPSVADLIDRDMKESKRRNEVGRLDFDPFIGGQDWAPTKIELKADPGPKPDRAVGTASFTSVGEKEPTVVTLDLARIAAGWRIADIHWKGQPDSLVAILSRKQ